MSSLTPIFINTGEARINTTPVPDSVAEWDDFLPNELLRQHPSLSNRPSKVVYIDIDEEQSDGRGSILITSNQVPIMHVPFVIRSGHLHPMDVYYEEGKEDEPKPLTRDRIRKVLFHSRIIEGLAPRTNRGELSDTAYKSIPPSGNNSWGSDGSFGKQAGFDLDKAVRRCIENIHVNTSVLDSAVKTASAEMYSIYERDMKTVEGTNAIHLMHKRGYTNAIEKVILGQKNAQPFSKIASVNKDQIYPETIRLKKVHPGAYDTFVSWSGKNTPMSKLSALTVREAKEVVQSIDANPSVHINDAEHQGEKIISAIRHEPTSSNVNLTEDLTPEKWIKATKEDNCKVSVFNKASGASLKGRLFGNVVSPSGGSTGKKLFVMGGDKYSYQAGMVVEKMDGEQFDSPVVDLATETPEVGQMGTFLSGDDKSIMTPFKIVALSHKWGSDTFTVEFDGGGRALISVSGMAIKPLRASKAGMSDRSITRMSSEHNENFGFSKDPAFLIPESWQYIRLGSSIDVESEVKEAEKTAAIGMIDSDPISVKCLSVGNDCDEFKIVSSKLNQEKVAGGWGYNTNNLSKIEAFHCLLSVGVPGDVANRSIKTAEAKGRATINGVRKAYAPNWSVKLAVAKMENAAPVIKEIRGLVEKENIVKLASQMQDDGVSSSVLATGLIGPENYEEFIENIPILEKAISFIATLLLAKRLDQELEFDERSLSSAMRLMDTVVHKLEKLRAVSQPS